MRNFDFFKFHTIDSSGHLKVWEKYISLQCLMEFLMFWKLRIFMIWEIFLLKSRFLKDYFFSGPLPTARVFSNADLLRQRRCPLHATGTDSGAVSGKCSLSGSDRQRLHVQESGAIQSENSHAHFGITGKYSYFTKIFNFMNLLE